MYGYHGPSPLVKLGVLLIGLGIVSSRFRRFGPMGMAGAWGGRPGFGAGPMGPWAFRHGPFGHIDPAALKDAPWGSQSHEEWANFMRKQFCGEQQTGEKAKAPEATNS